MEKKDGLNEIIVSVAKDLVKSTSDPGNWAGWVIYLLEALDEESRTNKKSSDFELTLAGLQDAISTRLKTGVW